MIRPIIFMVGIAVAAWQLPDILEKVFGSLQGKGLATTSLTEQLGLEAVASKPRPGQQVILGASRDQAEAERLRAEALRNAPLTVRSSLDEQGLTEKEKQELHKRKLRLIGERLGQADHPSRDP